MVLIYIDPQFESILFTLLVNHRKLNIITSYNPHFEFRNDYLKQFEVLINVISENAKTCISGDLNQVLLTSRGDLLLSVMYDYNVVNDVKSPLI